MRIILNTTPSITEMKKPANILNIFFYIKCDIYRDKYWIQKILNSLLNVNMEI